jgi:glycosyltransferase involved in cell wall biosynthesis
MRILLANHTSAYSGAEGSIFTIVAGLRAEHELAVACPSSGPLADAVDRAGVRRLVLPAITASLRPHPVQTPLGLGQIVLCGVALARAARRFGADVIHANSSRMGLAAAIARGLGAPPVVVRAHEHLPPTPVGRSVRRILLSSAEAVVAFSDFTTRRLNEGLRAPVVQCVYASIDHARFDPERVVAAPVRDELGIAPDAALLGQVAQITPWKGQATAVRALAELRRGGVDAHLLLVGHVAFGAKGVRYDNHAYLRELERLVAELGLAGSVHFLGQRSDVPEILRALDLHLLPSHEEPFGLVTIESQALGTPVLVSDTGSGPELVQDGVTGRTLPRDRPEAWAQAAAALLSDRPALARMGERGRAAAARYRDEVQAREMLAVYARAVAGAANGGRAREPAGASSWPS